MMNRSRLLFTMRTFRQLMISNAATLLLPLLISIILYAWVQNVILAQIDRTNETSLNQLRQEFDDDISALGIAADQLSMNDQIRTLANVLGEPVGHQRIAMAEIQTDLELQWASNRNIREIGIWFPGIGYYLTNNSRYAGDEYDTLALASYARSADEWFSWLEDGGYRSVRMLKLGEAGADGSRPDTLVLTQCVYASGFSGPSAIVSIVLEPEAIASSLERLKWNDECVLAVSDLSMSLVSSPVPGEFDSASSLHVVPNRNRPDQTTLSGMTYFTASIDSEVPLLQESHIRYTYLIPADSYLQEANAVRLIVILYVIFCLLAGFGLSFWLARRDYTPIHRMTQMVLKNLNASDWKGANDMTFLSDSLQELMRRNDSLERNLYTQKHVIRNNAIGALIRGRVEPGRDPVEACRAAGVDLLSAESLLIGISIGEESRPFFEEPAQGDDDTALLIRYMLASVFEELTGVQHRGMLFEMDDQLLCFVSLSPEHAETAETELHRTANEIRDLFSGKFGIWLSIAVGHRVESFWQLPEAYRDLRDMMECMALFGTKSQILCADEMDRRQPGSATNLSDSIAFHRVLRDLMHKGDYAAIAEEVNRHIEVNLSDASQSFRSMQLRMAGLVNTLVEAMAELRPTIGDALWVEINPMARLAAVKSLPELKTQVQEMFGKLQAIMEESRSMAPAELYVAACAHVDKHFSEPSLSVGSVAETLGVSLGYLSRAFKKSGGMGLLDYIHIQRVAEAKRLLAMTGLGVQDIAEQVGYGSRITLTRAFKKVEGTSPGDYRTTQGEGG